MCPLQYDSVRFIGLLTWQLDSPRISISTNSRGELDSVNLPPNFWMKGNEVRTCGIRDTGVALFRIYNLPNVDQQSQPIVFQRKYLLS